MDLIDTITKTIVGIIIVGSTYAVTKSAIAIIINPDNHGEYKKIILNILIAVILSITVFVIQKIIITYV